MKASRTRELTSAAAALIVVGAVAWTVEAGLFSSHSEVKTGDEILSVLPGRVVGLDYASEGVSVSARRTATSAPFDVAVSRSGNGQSTCQVDATLHGLLPALSRLQAVRVIDGGRFPDLFPISLGRLTLTDSISSEPIATIEFRTGKDGFPVAARLETIAVTTSLTAITFKDLERLCR